MMSVANSSCVLFSLTPFFAWHFLSFSKGLNVGFSHILLCINQFSSKRSCPSCCACKSNACCARTAFYKNSLNKVADLINLEVLQLARHRRFPFQEEKCADCRRVFSDMSRWARGESLRPGDVPDVQLMRRGTCRLIKYQTSLL